MKFELCKELVFFGCMVGSHYIHLLDKCLLKIFEIKYARDKLWHKVLQRDSPLGLIIQKTFKEHLPCAMHCAR